MSVRELLAGITQMLDRFTETVITILDRCDSEANQAAVGTDRLLVLLSQHSEIVAQSLKEQNIVSQSIVALVSEFSYEEEQYENTTRTKKFRLALERACKIADTLGDDAIDGEHLLLAILSITDARACRILQLLGLDSEAMQKKILSLRVDLPKPGTERPAKLSQDGNTPRVASSSDATNFKDAADLLHAVKLRYGQCSTYKASGHIDDIRFDVFFARPALRLEWWPLRTTDEPNRSSFVWSDGNRVLACLDYSVRSRELPTLSEAISESCVPTCGLTRVIAALLLFPTIEQFPSIANCKFSNLLVDKFVSDDCYVMSNSDECLVIKQKDLSLRRWTVSVSEETRRKSLAAVQTLPIAESEVERLTAIVSASSRPTSILDISESWFDAAIPLEIFHLEK